MPSQEYEIAVVDVDLSIAIALNSNWPLEDTENIDFLSFVEKCLSFSLWSRDMPPPPLSPHR